MSRFFPRGRGAAVVAGFAVLLSAFLALAQDQTPPDRSKLMKSMSDGNYKVALEGYRALALDPATDPTQVGSDLQYATQALMNLGQVNEYDALIEKAIEVHAKNPRLLWAAAQNYYHNGYAYGTIIAGTFERGPHRGGTGRFVYCMDRDRVRSLQLMRDSLALFPADLDKPTLAAFHLQFAQMILQHHGGDNSWRLQSLTDLSTLPDYIEQEHYYGRHHSGQGAPVSADGSPVFHRVPESWDAAKSDGERWRWCLHRAAELHPAHAPQLRYEFASFLRNQFDVHTLAQYGWWFRAEEEETTDSAKAAFAVHTLSETETIARLANGVKRFPLPDEFNFIRIYESIAKDPNNGYASAAQTMLAQIFEDRRQYPRAAQCWREAIERFGQNQGWQLRLDQIIGPWGQFEYLPSQPAGQGATVDFRFRNGKKVEFEAFGLDVPKLLGDIQTYLRSAPGQLDWNRVDPANIGYRLVSENQGQYNLGRVASWSLDLQPRKAHNDRRISVTTPLQEPGAYLLTARMEGGNTSRVVVWVADTAIVKKPIHGGTWVFVADAQDGQPLASADVQFFGYRQRWIQGTNKYQVDTQDFVLRTDGDGQAILAQQGELTQYAWMLVARKGKRMAFHGFSNIWGGQWHDQQYNATKVYGISDRPVYRPGHTVKFKIWMGQAQYDQEGNSPFAGQGFALTIHNPKGEKIYEKTLTADAWGGVQDEIVLPRDAALGVYSVRQMNWGGGFSFRVEEYKKPEFEVVVDAPSAPVMLGEKVTATVRAKYLFGAPVNEGKVKYKILRTPHDAQWFPSARWDWFYGRGYWWFAYDYLWYPGWGEWGCRRPTPWWWWQWHPPQQPELVAEVETAIAADGTVKVEIDTAVAKAVHGDQDHRYEITAEVTDPSRRVIVGQGAILVARKPFKVYAWVDRGHYRTGDPVHAEFQAQTLDGRPVPGKGVLRLLRITYGAEAKPIETEVERWDLPANERGNASQQIRAGQGGQYRLSYTVTDAAGHAIEGGYLFTVTGEGFGDGAAFRFNAVEVVPDKREYAPGETVELQLNINRTGGTVVLFARPANGIYLNPTILRLAGKSIPGKVAVTKKDMPNFFLEAITVANGKVHTDLREIVVPPARRVIDVALTPSKDRYRPGEKATVKLKLTGAGGEPVQGSTVVTIYDKAVDYIAGGSNVPDIRDFFWKWRRTHHSHDENSLQRGSGVVLKPGEHAMAYIGVFGIQGVDAPETNDSDGGVEESRSRKKDSGFGAAGRESLGALRSGGRAPAAPGAAAEGMSMAKEARREDGPADAMASMEMVAQAGGGGAQPPAMIEPVVRKNFADTALWVGALETDANGEAQVELTMPESLTGWKTRVWAMGKGTQVGEATTEVTTAKDLIVRLQAPRFFVQKDEVVLSANVHNYLKTKKSVEVVLELEGRCLEALVPLSRTVEVEPNGQTRVDWRVKVVVEGEATVRMKALSDEESDAMQMSFPVYVHGMLKTDSFSGVVRPDRDLASVTMRVPSERRPEQSRLEVRYSPTLAGAMVDALPYLTGYPYGCTEQTLNRFLPTVITQRILLKMGLDLASIREKRSNLNAQEIGDDAERAKDWKRVRDAMGRLAHEDPNPVFDEAVVKDMVQAGIDRLASMQCSDGGWGWFSGWGERSYPHTTAYVVHGLQIAQDNDVKLPAGMLERGVQWLQAYQREQLDRLNLPGNHRDHKRAADELDAFAYMVLTDARLESRPMREFLYRDRTHLAVYAKAMFALALIDADDGPKLAMLKENIEQFLVQDDENQTAYLRLPESNHWWYWYGSEYEAQAYYLKLLAATEPKSDKASRLVKYLVNNRRHATYWNSTRDTAVCIEAMADFITASGEDAPDLTVELWLDGKKSKEVAINRDNLFSYDNRLVLTGADLNSGEHVLEVRRRGKGPVYFNAYLTNFTLEDAIGPAGLEIKVERKAYKLTRVDKTEEVAGAHGQVVDQKVEKYERTRLADGATLKSGDLIEVELEIESKNDYEYIIFEDMKAAGFEAVDVRSGYTRNDLGAYVEYRDERVAFFVRTLARGRHSVSYRLRAEIPGRFSALPARASAMYAPELKANSSEIKLAIED